VVHPENQATLLSATIEDLKFMIQDIRGNPTDEQQLTFVSTTGGIQLEDARSIKIRLLIYLNINFF
jgi:hypothetical protein